LGKHSGRHAFRYRLRKLGYDLSEKDIDHLFKKFKDLADKRKQLVDEDLEVLVAEEILRVADTYRLKYLNVISGTTTVPSATVQLEIKGKKVEQNAGFGIGPIDATYNTIARITGTKSRLLGFSIDALTGGTDAQGGVTVRLEEKGVQTMGKGADPDIIIASAKAYINGLNRLEQLKRKKRR
jgi:2-isopropylmalate synthase